VKALFSKFNRDEIPPNDVFVGVKLFVLLVVALLLPNTDGDVAPLKAEKGDDVLLLLVPPNTDAVFPECSPKGVVKGVIDNDDRGGVALVVAARLPKDAPFELAVPKAVPKEDEFVCVIDDRGGVVVVAAARLPNEAPFELEVPTAVPNEEECLVPEIVALMPLPKAPNPPALVLVVVVAFVFARSPKVLGAAPFPMALAKAPNLSNPPEVAAAAEDDDADADPTVPKEDEFVFGAACTVDPLFSDKVMTLLKAPNLSKPPEVAEEDDDVPDEFRFGLVRLPNVVDAIVPEFLMELPKEMPPSPPTPNPNADFPFPAVEEKGEHPVVPPPNELLVPKAEVAVVDDAAVLEPLAILEVVLSLCIPIEGISFPVVSSSMIPHDGICIY